MNNACGSLVVFVVSVHLPNMHTVHADTPGLIMKQGPRNTGRYRTQIFADGLTFFATDEEFKIVSVWDDVP